MIEKDKFIYEKAIEMFSVTFKIISVFNLYNYICIQLGLIYSS